MTRYQSPILLVTAAILVSSTPIASADEATFNRKEDVIYGRKYGTALTMDVFTPTKDAKGIGIVFVVSGGFLKLYPFVSLRLAAATCDRR